MAASPNSYLKHMESMDSSLTITKAIQICKTRYAILFQTNSQYIRIAKAHFCYSHATTNTHKLHYTVYSPMHACTYIYTHLSSEER